MAALSAEQVAQIFYQAGARGEVLERFVAIARRESGYNPSAHRTDSDPARLSGDRGLAQINAVWDQQLQAAGIISSKQDLFDPVKNAQAAMYVLQKQGWAAWGMGSSGWAAGGDPLKGTNVTEAQAAVQRAQAQGLLGKPFSGSTGTSGGTVGLPSDATIVNHHGGLYAVFEPVPGTAVFYAITDQSQAAGRPVVTADIWQRWPNAVNAGDAKELESTAQTFGTFKGQWDSIIAQVMGSGNPAAKDPEVLKVLAEFAGRPDMSTAELQNKLRGTKYWQARTEQELAWNSLSEAERVKRRQETAAQMSQSWADFAGYQVPIGDWFKDGKGAIVEKLASGKVSMSEWIESSVKPFAARRAESPWARQVRNEQENQRQRGIDVENTVLNLRQTLEKWGLQWSEATLQEWGRNIMEKRSSDKDFIETVKDQAMVKYGMWKKNRDMETATEAAPWIDTYSRLMEKQGTLFTADVAQALNQGQDLWTFEQNLKKKPAWGETKNGREAITTAVGELGAMFGFAA